MTATITTPATIEPRPTVADIDARCNGMLGQSGNRERILELAATIAAFAHPDHPFAAHDLNAAERNAVVLLTAFDALDLQPPMSTFGLRLGLSRAAVTALVDRFAADGLVERVADPTDRRRTLLQATQACITLAHDACAVAWSMREQDDDE